jgi:hypothetical protein
MGSFTSALDVAKLYIKNGVRESEGKNRSAVIDILVQKAGGPTLKRGVAGPPYCAYGVSACFREFENNLNDAEIMHFQINNYSHFPMSGGSQFIKNWFRDRGWYTKDPNKIKEWRGALFGWTNADGIHGHIGFVGERKTHFLFQHLTGVGTWEFNTSPQTRDRDGEGAYHLNRSIKELQMRNFWFLRTDYIVGGRWWK